MSNALREQCRCLRCYYCSDGGISGERRSLQERRGASGRDSRRRTYLIWDRQTGAEREGTVSVHGRLCASNDKFSSSPSNFATVDVSFFFFFLPFFPGRKIAFLFSSLKSPFVILKVPRCLCLFRQLAAALLKIAGGGNRYTLNIKNRKGSTGVNNAWERIPLMLASRSSGGGGVWLWAEPRRTRGD